MARGQWDGAPGPHCPSLPGSLCSSAVGCVPVLLCTGTASSSSPARAEPRHWHVPPQVCPWLVRGSGALQDSLLGLVTVTPCLGLGTGPRDSAGIPGHSRGRGPHTSAGGFPHVQQRWPLGSGHLCPCHSDGARAQGHPRLTAALSALPPRVPRGRHEPVPPLAVAGRTGSPSPHGGDLGAAETLCRYSGCAAGTLPSPGSTDWDVAVALAGHSHAAVSPGSVP